MKWNLTVSRLKVVAADVTSASSGGALIGAGTGSDLKITVDNVMLQYPKVLTTTKKIRRIPGKSMPVQ